MRAWLERWLQQVWYGPGIAKWLLLPLSVVYGLAVAVRRWMYSGGILKQVHLPVPVVVVGNLTAGGTGKTPVTIWLACALRERGFTPGIVSRGYGGSRSDAPMRVDAMSDPAVVGDEPVLLARRTGLPVCVDRNRVRAAEMLVEDGVDLVIADDGLQHLRLGRSYEICVVDGSRGFGNHLPLPAGPMRDTLKRLCEVDQVLVNGPVTAPCPTAAEQNAMAFELRAAEARRLNGSLVRPLAAFAGRTVHAVAAIGNPTRFFRQLRTADIQVIEHALPDHAPLAPADVDFADAFDVLMTEKDAVKLGNRLGDRYWYVPVEVIADPAQAAPWLDQMVSRLRGATISPAGERQAETPG